MALLVQCEEIGTDISIGLLRVLKDIFLYGFSARKARRLLIAAGPVVLRSLYYDKYLAELNAQLAAMENILARNDFQAVQHQVEIVSWELLRAAIAERFNEANTRPIFTERDLWQKYASVLDDYPVVLSTTHSIKNITIP